MNKYFDTDKIKELYPEVEEMLIPPMLIYKGTDSQLKNCDNGEWFAQLKKDGVLIAHNNPLIKQINDNKHKTIYFDLKDAEIKD